jgi:hypothetical protein
MIQVPASTAESTAGRLKVQQVTVADLADRKVQVPSAFRIPRSNIVWTNAFRARVNVTLTRKVGAQWSVKPEEQVLVLRNGFWANMQDEQQAERPFNAAHAAHMQCGRERVLDAAHQLRHAGRNAGCADCSALVRDAHRLMAAEAEAKAQAAAEAQAREERALANIAAVKLAGPSVDEAFACGHDGKQVAILVANWAANETLDQFKVGDKVIRRLGRGVSRVAVDPGCGKHVIKVQYGRGGAVGEQAHAECEFYMAATEEQRQDLARIFAWTPDYKGVVVERAYMNNADLVAAMRARANKMGIGDLHGNNIGFRTNGQPIVLDYGL